VLAKGRVDNPNMARFWTRAVRYPALAAVSLALLFGVSGAIGWPLAWTGVAIAYVMFTLAGRIARLAANREKIPVPQAQPVRTPPADFIERLSESREEAEALPRSA
jgi:hypothetical protein